MRLFRHLQHWLSGHGQRLHVADFVPVTHPIRQWADTFPSEQGSQRVTDATTLYKQTSSTHPGRMCGIKPTHSRWDVACEPCSSIRHYF